MPFTIVRQDITRMDVDAIVNAANTELLMGGGVCGAIFNAAGASRMQAACDRVSPINTGGAAITPGFDLPAKYVVHAAGPVYHHWNGEENKRLLRSAYTESLKLACAYQCESIAFPLISSGIYGYPKDEALQVAISAIRDFLVNFEMDVYLVIFDKTTFEISETLLCAVESFIDDNYVDCHLIHRRELLDVERQAMISQPVQDLEEMMDALSEPFHIALLHLIDAKGKTDPEVYKRANIDRKLFSKIRKGNGYIPGKRTILALSIALELTLEETDALLKKAGYALSNSQKFDVIVAFFLVNRKYDIFEINEVLFEYNQPLLGAH